jgi:hypothetical protein
MTNSEIKASMDASFQAQAALLDLNKVVQQVQSTIERLEAKSK